MDEVLLTFYHKNREIVQSGILYGDEILTTGAPILLKHFLTLHSSKISLEHFKLVPLTIEVALLNKDHSVLKKTCNLINIWSSCKVNEALLSTFQKLDTKDLSANKMASLMSYFLLFKLDNEKICSENFSKMHYTLLNTEISRGENILIVMTPFGVEDFLNSHSTGVVSNLLGKQNDLILTDARLAPCCEGAPIFRENGSERIFLGMILLSMSSLDGNMVGFSLGATTSSIFANFNQDEKSKLKPISGKLNNLDSFSITDISSIVRVRSGRSRGTGVIIDSSGIIITCAHVINYGNCDDIEIKCLNGEVYNARMIFCSPKLDIALVTVPLKGEAGQVLLEDTSPHQGETVYAIGYSLFQDEVFPNISKGVITKCSGSSSLFTSCVIHNGASGGAIILPNGNLIGIIAYNIKLIDVNNVICPDVNMCIPLSAIYQPLTLFLSTQDMAHLESLQNKHLVNSYQLALKSKM